jgi:hypothetical protein
MNHPETIAAKAQWDAVAAILGADGDCPDSVMKAARAALSAASPGAGVTEALAKQFASNEQHERHNTNEETRYWCDQWKLLARQALSAARGE